MQKKETERREIYKEIFFDGASLIFGLIVIFRIFKNPLVIFSNLRNFTLLVCFLLLLFSSKIGEIPSFISQKSLKKPTLNLSDGTRIVLVILGFLALTLTLTF